MLSACEREVVRDAGPLARERGRAVFRQHCVLCHGEAADGRGPRSFALDPPAVDFGSHSWRARVDPRRVSAAIRQGVHGTSMPAWPGLTDDEVGDLTAYVLSVAERGP